MLKNRRKSSLRSADQPALRVRDAVFAGETIDMNIANEAICIGWTNHSKIYPASYGWVISEEKKDNRDVCTRLLSNCEPEPYKAELMVKRYSDFREGSTSYQPSNVQFTLNFNRMLALPAEFLNASKFDSKLWINNAYTSSIN